MRPAAVLAVLILAPVGDAVAQYHLTLMLGQRVRVTATSLGMNKHEDTLRELRGDTLVLESMPCLLKDVERLEVYAGRRTYKTRGALIGAAMGILIGVPVGIDARKSDPCEDSFAWCPDPIPSVPIFLGLLGAGVGALTADVLGTDRWKEVSLDWVQVSTAPTHRGIGIGARIAF